MRMRLAPSWTLLYSLDQHGISLSTLYRKVKGKGPCVLAIKNANNEVCIIDLGARLFNRVFLHCTFDRYSVDISMSL
jgi:hypothetical protein